MDIKEAIQLIKQGRFEEMDVEDLWELEEILSSSNDYNAVQAYITFKKTNIAQNLNNISMQMKTWVDTNLQIVNNLDKGFNLFQLNSKSDFVYPEANGLFCFFNNINVNNSKNDINSDDVNKKSIFEAFYSLGKLGAKEKLCLNKSFSKLKPAEQTNLYKDAIVNSMQEDTFVLVSNQIFEDAMTKNPQAKEFLAPEKAKMESDACKRFKAITNEADTSYKISRSNVIGTLGASVNRISEISETIEKRTQSNGLSSFVKKTDEKFATKFGTDYTQLSVLKKAMSLSFIAGSVGMAAHNASKLSKSIKDFTKKEGTNIYNIVKNNPAKTVVLGAGIAATIAASQASISAGIDMGLIGRNVADNWKILTTSIPIDVVSNTFSGIAKSTTVAATTIKASLAVLGTKASAAFSQKDSGKKAVMLKKLKKAILFGPLGKALKLNKEEITPIKTLQESNVIDFKSITPVQDAIQTHKRREYPAVAANFSTKDSKHTTYPQLKLDSYNTEPKVVTSNPLEAKGERNTSLTQPNVFYNRALFKPIGETLTTQKSLNVESTKSAFNARNEYLARKHSGR